MEKYQGFHPTVEALAHGSLQGVLAAIPVVTWLRTKEAQSFAALTEQAARTGQTPAAAPKLAMRESTIVGALIVATSVIHGATRGYRKSHAAHQQFRSHAERLADRPHGLHSHETARAGERGHHGQAR